MKKIFAVALICLTINNIAWAQWTHFGVKAGIGPATYVDDITVSGPVTGLSVGGWIEYGFTEAEAMYANNFYLQTGLNLIRRGCNFEEVKEFGVNFDTRSGFSHAWYVQLPFFACFRYELPIPEADHYITMHVGPAVSFGAFGNYRERRIAPYKPQTSYNYDTYVDADPSLRKAFNTLRRLDVNFILRFGYQHKNYAFDLYLDYGFLATSVDPDALKENEQNQLPDNDPDKKNMRTVAPNGNNLAIMASASWRIPIKNRDDK